MGHTGLGSRKKTGCWARTPIPRSPSGWGERDSRFRFDASGWGSDDDRRDTHFTKGTPKRHAGADPWEVTVGADTSAKVVLHGAKPTGQRANANQAAATDLATVIMLANELRAALLEKGIIKGAL